MLISKTLKIFVITLAVIGIPAVVFAVPQLPHLFYGTITINGSQAPAGTVVIAKVGGGEKGRIITAAIGKYGGAGAYDGKLVVQGDDLTNGNTITFAVSGANGIPTATFENGKVEQLDLSFTISQVEVTNNNLDSLLDNGTLAVSGTNENAASLNVTQQTVVNVAVDGGTNKVTLTKDTIITKVEGGTFNANNLTANSVTTSSLSGLASGEVVKGALQWGIASLGLEFSKPITVQIYVGTSLNGQTLNVQRSTTGNSGWTDDGIVPPATCVVASGYCSFSATKASYYAASQTVVTPTPTPSSSGGSSGYYPTPTPSTTPLSTAAQKVDTNKDGKINILDFNSLMINWGKTGTSNIADFNSDGKVDILDFNSLMINWTG